MKKKPFTEKLYHFCIAFDVVLLIAILLLTPTLFSKVQAASIGEGQFKRPDPALSVAPTPDTTNKLQHTSPTQVYTVPVEDIERMSQAVWGEARGCTPTEQAAVVWCILNRVDDPRWPDTIEEVCITSQFNGYNPDNPIDPDIYTLTLDVYVRWVREHTGEQDVGRVLPASYCFFYGDGKHNHFQESFGADEVWDWSLPSPYENI